MLYSFARSLFVLFFRIFYRYKFPRNQNIPAGEAFIVCANHTSYLDPPFVGCLISGKKVHFMAKEELFGYFLLGRGIKAVGAFPVKRGAIDRGALTYSINLLKEGHVLGVFPEGKRIKTGNLGEILHGPAYIALKSQRPILPVVIKWPSGIFRPVRVKTGSLIYFQDEGKIGKKAIENASRKVAEEMAGLWSDL